MKCGWVRVGVCFFIFRDPGHLGYVRAGGQVVRSCPLNARIDNVFDASLVSASLDNPQAVTFAQIFSVTPCLLSFSVEKLIFLENSLERIT